MQKNILASFIVISFLLYAFRYQGIMAGADISPLPAATVTPALPAPIGKTNSTGVYKDGTYTGPVVDAYYGNVQVQAIVSGGKITDVQFLDHPQDRRTSQMINDQAMPMLKTEALEAQSAQVDGVSGATATSQAFIQSLDSALKQAKI